MNAFTRFSVTVAVWLLLGSTGPFAGHNGASGSTPQARPSYPLVCRGGGDLHFSYQPPSGLKGGPEIWLTFVRGAAAAGAKRENVAALGPGQCTWVDRTVSAAEPDIVVLPMSLFGGRRFSIAWRATGQLAGIASEMHEINGLMGSQTVMTFLAYNDGKQHFVVTALQ